MSGQAPSSISYSPIFYVRENVLSDSSTIWEVWQRGSEQRLASSSHEDKAQAFASRLLSECGRFESDIDNTVDA